MGATTPSGNQQRTAMPRRRSAAIALGLGLAALVLAAGSAAASIQIPNGPGAITQAVGSKVATVYNSVHDGKHVAGTTFPVGVRIHPAAVVTGNDGTPTGTVVGYFYGSSDCTGASAGYSRPLPANATLDDVTLNWVSDVATTLSVRVRYLGDATYAAAWGPCRTITYTKVSPTITLKVHDWNDAVVTKLPFNMEVHAAISVSGALDAPTGFVLVRGWANATCEGTDFDYTTQNLDADGTADWVLPETFDAPSMRSYKARYYGDDTYTSLWSGCVSVEGTKADAGLTFILHDANHTVAQIDNLLGTAIHASVGAFGQAGQPTGTLTIHVYTGKDCQSQAFEQSTAAVASLDSGTFGKAFPGAPGWISWKLTYSGDASYKAGSSACVNRHFLAQATVSIDVHDATHDAVTSIVLGSKLHLSAVVTGNFGAITGQIALQASEAGACTGGAAFAVPALVGGASDDASLTFKPHAVETVWFQATYLGDGTSYAASKSACVPIQVTAAPATAAPAATPKPTVAPTAGSTAAPGGTPDAGQTAEPSSPVETDAAPVAPTAGATAPAGSDAPSATDGPTASDAGAAGGSVTPGSGADGGTGLVVGALALLLLLLGGATWFALGSRRKGQRYPAPATAAEPLSAARSS